MRGFWWSLAGFWVLALAATTPPAARAAPPWAEDPILVYYPRGDCRGEALELEIWDRDASAWRPHPGHHRVQLESCQLEDAGNLLNEIRYRCLESPTADPPAPWMVGLDVFDSQVMQTCGEQPQAEPTAGLQVHVETPAPGARVAEPIMQVGVHGAVMLNGIPGTNADLLLVIDRSAGGREADGDRLAAQLQAADALLRRVEPRLGLVRVGIATYPNLPPRRGSFGNAGARRVVALTDDLTALRQGLRELGREGVSGFQTFGSAFEFALAELAGRNPGSGARPAARKLLVMVAADEGDAPRFTRGAGGADPEPGLLPWLERAKQSHTQLQLFALGGLAEAPDPALESALEAAGAAFHRVLRPSFGKPFFAAVPIPSVSRVLVANRTLGSEARSARVTPDGRFEATLGATTGTNRLWARATLSDGASAEREWDFEFDDSLFRERLLAAEREHMRRVREKRIELTPLWHERLPAPEAEATPTE